MNDEDIKQFVKAFEDFMRHSEVEQLKYEIRTPKHMVRIDNVEVAIPDENQLTASYEQKAAELEVTVDYYIQEFV